MIFFNLKKEKIKVESSSEHCCSVFTRFCTASRRWQERGLSGFPARPSTSAGPSCQWRWWRRRDGTRARRAPVETHQVVKTLPSSRWNLELQMFPIETKYLVRGRYWESTSPIFTLAGPKTSLERFPSKRRELAMRRKESSRDQPLIPRQRE